MASTGKRRKGGTRPPSKRSPKKGNPQRAKPVPARTRTRTPKKSPKKPIKKARKPSKKQARSAAAKKGWATRRFAEAIERERAEREEREGFDPGYDDAEVIDEAGVDVDPDYRVYPVRPIERIERDSGPTEIESFIYVDRHSYAAALEWLEDRFGVDKGEDDGEIEWFPTFDEVYDYIDGLVEEFDLDAHELFELAFGYAGSDTV